MFLFNRIFTIIYWWSACSFIGVGIEYYSDDFSKGREENEDLGHFWAKEVDGKEDPVLRLHSQSSEGLVQK